MKLGLSRRKIRWLRSVTRLLVAPAQAPTIDSGTTASFAYDPLGRRISKNILGTTTSFLYDGANAVQDRSPIRAAHCKPPIPSTPSATPRRVAQQIPTPSPIRAAKQTRRVSTSTAPDTTTRSSNGSLAKTLLGSWQGQMLLLTRTKIQSIESIPWVWNPEQPTTLIGKPSEAFRHRQVLRLVDLRTTTALLSLVLGSVEMSKLTAAAIGMAPFRLWHPQAGDGRSAHLGQGVGLTGQIRRRTISRTSLMD